MKKFIVSMTTGFWLLTAVPVAAQEDLGACTLLKDLAESIMTNRQIGVDVTKMLGISENELIKSIVLHDYSRPGYSTLEYQKKSVKEFGLDVFMECIKE